MAQLVSSVLSAELYKFAIWVNVEAQDWIWGYDDRHPSRSRSPAKRRPHSLGSMTCGESHPFAPLAASSWSSNRVWVMNFLLTSVTTVHAEEMYRLRDPRHQRMWSPLYKACLDGFSGQPHLEERFAYAAEPVQKAVITACTKHCSQWKFSYVGDSLQCSSDYLLQVQASSAITEKDYAE